MLELINWLLVAIDLIAGNPSILTAPSASPWMETPPAISAPMDEIQDP